ncbi:hypothetical protein BDD12DRAFT_855244, partial [Trichophaea hybrida]
EANAITSPCCRLILSPFVIIQSTRAYFGQLSCKSNSVLQTVSVITSACDKGGDPINKSTKNHKYDQLQGEIWVGRRTSVVLISCRL